MRIPAVCAVLGALATTAPAGALAAPGPQATPPGVRHRALAFEGAPVHMLVVPRGSEVRPVARRVGRTVPNWLATAGGVAAINGGYFNHSDGWAVSHVVADGRALTQPEANRALIGNPVLAPHLPTILGARTAWFDGPGGWGLAPWNRPPAGWRSGLQAGPALLPASGLVAEAFVIRAKGGAVVRDGIGSASRAPRSALGLRPDGTMVWAVAGAPGLTIPRLGALMTSLGCDRAMALDGGSSSTLAWMEGPAPGTSARPGVPKARVFVGKGGGSVLVNSALVVMR